MDKILIVDDSVTALKMTGKIFKDKYYCEYAMTYDEAIDKIKNNHYVAIIMDFYLEYVDDDKIVEKINEIRTYTNGSVFIVCSSDDTIAKRSNLNNVDHFVHKSRISIIPDRIERIRENKKKVYEKSDIFSKLLKDIM